MLNEVVMKILLTIVGFITTGLLGYLTAKVKEYKRNDINQEEALSKYYVYTELGTIPTYEKENLTYMYEQYKRMGGNSYITTIMEEIERLPIKK